jgi:hypothetical protein
MTTTTAFLIPGTVTQVTDNNGIAWSNILGSVGRDQAGAQSAVTSKELYTISGLWQERFASKTNQLWFTNFNIPDLRTYTTYVPQVGYRYTYTTGHNGITTGPTTSTTMQMDLGWDKILTLFTPDASTSNWNLSDSGQLDNAGQPFTRLNSEYLSGSLLSNTFYVIIANNTVQGYYRNGLLNLFNINSTYYALYDFSGFVSGTTLYFYNVQLGVGFRHFPTTTSQIVWADSSVSLIGSGFMSGPYTIGDTAGNVNLTMEFTTPGSEAFPIAIQTTNYAPAVPSTVSYVPTILGIEVKFNSLRVNRVQDYIVQLVLNGALVGDNIADPITDNLKTYGSPTNIWNSSIALTDVSNATFGVAISLRSNVLTPHSDLGYLDQVRMRITYS